MTGGGRERRSMHRAGLVSLVGIALLFATPAAAATAAEEAVCDAIRDLGLAAVAGGEPQRVGFGRLGPQRAGCGPTDTPAREEFCKVMVEKVGLASPQRFPWMVYDCLGMSRGIPKIETAEEYSGVPGRKKIVLLTASMKEGFGVEIRFVPSGDFGVTPYYKNYFGTYTLTVWKL